MAERPERSQHERCGQCRWFVSQGEIMVPTGEDEAGRTIEESIGEAGFCQFNPPQVPLPKRSQNILDGMGMFPVVSSEAWCGKWEKVPIILAMGR